MNPHLINGLKYDLRVYVLVTSFNPLTVYIYNDGLVRFATEKYNLDPNNINQKFVHLTNFSINKKNLPKFVQNNDSDEDGEGDSSKWNFAQLEAAFDKLGLNYGSTFLQIRQIVIKTLISVEKSINSNLEQSHTLRNNCFELFGFDIIIDSNLRPWVLEVNVLPSLSSSSAFDKRIKTMLICDTLTLIGIKSYEKLSFHKLSAAEKVLAPFQETLSIEELIQKVKLNGKETLSEDEIDMILTLEEEYSRRGNFTRVYPLASNLQYFDKYFEPKRYRNCLIAAYILATDEIK